ncbi:hypothetical protein BDV25DRAFT_146885 [Aspergillus avenaceus]|uniref:Uncharacterized protein n=1 Tax=Aspergillus avenaceus TaxID=36643 RepID=A0A5N6U8U6_ASPAV|nr:hypothetical protein BDV25DRAFT_146885 [Aspergillus avenaceus]
MSTTTTAAATTSTACTGATQWQIPIQDAACALHKTGNYSSIMDKCCTPAKVSTTDDGCTLYCLAQGQTTGDLQDCFRDQGAQYQDIFCNKSQKNATATASLASSTGSKTGSSTGGSASSTSSDSAGYAVQPAVSKGGLGVLAMMFCSVLMGVVA